MPHPRSTALVILALSSATLLAACSTGTPDSSTGAESSSGTSVVATTTILGDIASQIVACADTGATVTTLMPVGADPHDFAPSSAQVADLVRADLVVANGLGLEAGLTDALEGATTDGARVLEVGELIDPLPFGAHEDNHAEDPAATEEDHDHGSEDPHFWFDMARMATAAELIGDVLAEGGDSSYTECGVEVATKIRAAEDEVRATLATIPDERRILVTDHDAFGYLAQAYGFEVIGTVIPGGSTLGEPSSAELADLVTAINTAGVPAIFANTAASSALSDAVAAETGRDIVVVPLYVGSLGEPGSGAEDYVGLMRTDAALIAEALNR